MISNPRKQIDLAVVVPKRKYIAPATQLHCFSVATRKSCQEERAIFSVSFRARDAEGRRQNQNACRFVPHGTLSGQSSTQTRRSRRERPTSLGKVQAAQQVLEARVVADRV